MRKTIVLGIVFLSVLIFSCQKKDSELSYNLTLKYDNQKGTLIINPNKKEYKNGDKINIKAIPKQGYKFLDWDGNISKSNKNKSEFDFVIQEDIELIANFSLLDKYKLKVNFDKNKGDVLVEPTKSLYSIGEKITLKAIAKQGFKFESWQGEIKSENNILNLNINKDLNIDCVFSKEEIEEIEEVLPKLIIEGSFNKKTKDWTFEAKLNNYTDKISDFEIKIDNKVMEFNEFFERFEIKNLVRQDDDSEFQIIVSSSKLKPQLYKLKPIHFEDDNNIESEKLSEKSSVKLKWTNLNINNYRIFRELLSENTSIKTVYKNYLKVNYCVFDTNDIWISSNSSSTEKWNKLRLWVVPVKSIKLNNSFSKDSYIEILGQRTYKMEARR